MKSSYFIQSIALTAIFILPLFLTAQNDLPNYRPYDQRGVNMFETPKKGQEKVEGFKVRIGGNFTQQFQALSHENTASPVDKNNDGINDNKLIDLTNGFNLATANLNIDAQLDDGITLNLTTYLSSRHHQEAWVKGGYLQFDKLPFIKSEAIDKLMNNLTIKAGHMEVNYGDAHFRRSDNGLTMYNPFVEGYIMDAFTTEIGAEFIFQKNGLIGLGSITGGEIKGDVVALPPATETDKISKRAPSLIGKLGFDKQVNNDFRARVTGSVYYTASSRSNTLFAGDRTGSRYYLVLENSLATTNGNFTSGRFNPGFRDKVASFMGNVFLKYKGIEFFGTYENANGRASNEADMRNATQLAGDLILRFGKKENFFIAGRYNTVKAEIAGAADKVTIDRIAGSAGWFMTKNILLKAEYVTQEYKDFPATNILNGGKFEGVMVEAAIGF